MLKILNEAKLSFQKKGKMKILPDVHGLPRLAPTTLFWRKITRRVLSETNNKINERK